jgi:hypothetical protein
LDAACPSLPPKILVADKVRPNEQTTAYIAAHGCHFIECSLYDLLFSIEVFFLTVRDQSFARIVLYEVSIEIVSRTFYEKRSPQLRDFRACQGLPLRVGRERERYAIYRMPSTLRIEKTWH